MTHICVGNLTIIGSDNGLSPGRRQAIIRTNAGILLKRPLGTNFSEFLVKILIFSFKKMRLKVSSAKRRPFCLGLNELTMLWQDSIIPRDHFVYEPSQWATALQCNIDCISLAGHIHKTIPVHLNYHIWVIGYDMETLYALLFLRARNPPVTCIADGFPAQTATNSELWWCLCCKPMPAWICFWTNSWVKRYDALTVMWCYPNEKPTPDL